MYYSDDEIIEKFRERLTPDETPLHKASLIGHLEVVKYLLSSGVEVDSKTEFNSTPLHFASENGHLEVVSHLVSCGANVNSVEEDGWTPLHYAAYNGFEEVILFLLKNGSDPTIRSNKHNDEEYRNKTASEIASIRKHGKVESLIENWKSNRT